MNIASRLRIKKKQRSDTYGWDPELVIAGHNIGCRSDLRKAVVKSYVEISWSISTNWRYWATTRNVKRNQFVCDVARPTVAVRPFEWWRHATEQAAGRCSSGEMHGCRLMGHAAILYRSEDVINHIQDQIVNQRTRSNRNIAWNCVCDSVNNWQIQRLFWANKSRVNGRSRARSTVVLRLSCLPIWSFQKRDPMICQWLRQPFFHRRVLLHLLWNDKIWSDCDSCSVGQNRVASLPALLLAILVARCTLGGCPVPQRLHQ